MLFLLLAVFIAIPVCECTWLCVSVCAYELIISNFNIY